MNDFNDDRNECEGQAEFCVNDYFSALEAANLCCRCMEASPAPVCSDCSAELDAFFPSWTPSDVLEAEAELAPF